MVRHYDLDLSPNLNRSAGSADHDEHTISRYWGGETGLDGYLIKVFEHFTGNNQSGCVKRAEESIGWIAFTCS
jgi:hypothetical protein